MATDEQSLNEALAHLLGGVAHIPLRHDVDGVTHIIDVNVGNWIIECSVGHMGNDGQNDAYLICKYRIGKGRIANPHHVCAVEYDKNDEEISWDNHLTDSDTMNDETIVSRCFFSTIGSPLDMTRITIAELRDELRSSLPFDDDGGKR